MSVTELDGWDNNGLRLSYLGQATGQDDGLRRIRTAVESADGLLGFIEADVRINLIGYQHNTLRPTEGFDDLDAFR